MENKFQKKSLLIFIGVFFTLIFFAHGASAATYYVDSTGGLDSNAGTDIDHPWKTASKVNGSSFSPGDSVLFKRGQVWRESLTIPSAGSTGNPITYGAYGSGNEKPIFYGSDNLGTYASYNGSNYMINSSFENFTGTADDEVADTFSNYAINTNTFAESTNSPPDGTYDLRLYDNGPTNGQIRQTGISLPAGKTFAILCKHRSDGTAAAVYSIRQESGSQLYLQTNGTWAAGSAYLSLGLASQTNWTQTAIRYFTTPNDYNGTYWLSINNVTNSSSAYVDDFRVELYEWSNTTGDEYKIVHTNSSGWSDQPVLAAWLNNGTWQRLTRGTAGSLNAGEWDYVFPYFYINLGAGVDPSGQQIEVSNRFDVISLADKSYVTLDNLSAMFGEDNGIDLGGTESNDIISNCYVFGNGNDGINGHGTITDVLIQSCEVRENGQGRGIGGAPGDGISFHESCTGTIEDNTVIDNDKAGIDNIDATVFISRRNFLKHNAANLLVGGSTTGTHSFYDNVVVVEADDTCGLWQNNGSTATMHAYNNTIFGSGSGTGIIIGTGAKTVDLKNNIITDLSKGIDVDGGTVTANYNLVHGNTTQYEGITAGINDVSSEAVFTNSGAEDFSLQSTSPAIDAGTDVGLTADYAGNSIYGLPDMGAYEYQPPYTSGTNEIDTGAGARIYGDGKFENINSTSGTTADLSVVPQGSQTIKWLDISAPTGESNIVWEANHKEWKETSTTLGDTDTLHAIGDLTAGKSYTLKIDGSLATANITGSDCSNGICTAGDDGEITFTYTGGYSTHTFDLSDDIAPIINITSPETGDNVSADDTNTFTDSEQTNPQCSLDNSHWVNCTSSVTSFSQLTGWSDIVEKGTFTLYMRDTDSAGNTGTASVANLTKADTHAPVRSDGSPSSELSSNTNSVTLSLKTDENATCKYSTTSNKSYADMGNTFSTTGEKVHSQTINNLSTGESFVYYVRCRDEAANTNDTDYLISFSIASTNTDENTDNEENDSNDDKKDLNVHKVKAEATENTVTITWKTDHNSKSSVRYGTDRNLREKKKDKDKEKNHKMVLKDLLPDTKYYFRIKATDSDDNEDSSRIHSIKTLPKETTAIQTVSSSQSENPVQTPPETGNNTNSSNTTPSTCSYTVESGDSLWTIAKKVYGDATQYQKIIDLNPDSNTDTLKIGQELKLCDSNQAQEESQNNSGSGNSNQQNSNTNETSNSSQNQTEAKTFHWWNPFSWF